MKWLGVKVIALMMVLLISAVALSAPVAEKVQADGEVALDFRDVELVDLIQIVSEMTGKNFIYDDSIKGKVNIISPDRMSPSEAYEAFLSVLSVKGYALVPAGSTNKIVPLSVASQNRLPTGSVNRNSEQIVTRLIRLQYVDAATLVTSVLAPLVPKTSHVSAYAPSNTLIITDSAANIQRLVQIILQLDMPAALDQIEIIPLQYADSVQIAEIVNQLLSHSGATSPVARRRGAAAANAGSGDNRQVIPYERSNALILLAAGEDSDMVRKLIARLDQPAPDERSDINVYYLENADATSMAETLNTILTGIRKTESGKDPKAAPAAQAPLLNPKQVSITADKPTNSLIISARPEEYEILKGIIAKLDIRRKQIFVEAMILELSLNATRDLGISLSGAGGPGNNALLGTSNLNSGSANNTDFLDNTDSGLPDVLGNVVNGLLLGGFFNPVSIVGPDGTIISVPAATALISLSQTDGDVNVLAAPRLLTSDNEEAEIIIGENVPIITSRLTDTTNVGAQSVAIERQDVALTLRFTPQITEGNSVRLNLFQEITNISDTSVGSVDLVGPTLTKRMLRNTVVAEDGQTVVLGGLISSTMTDSVTKVPLLGDIPLLGWLFRSTSKKERKTNLLVFITPTIIRDDDDLAAVTNRSRTAMDRYRNESVNFDQPVEQLQKGLLNPVEKSVVNPIDNSAPDLIEEP
jgi:general secretion pathway protein D